MSLKLTYYKNELFRTHHRGSGKGKVSNAKPYLIISIIDLIENGIIKDNHIYFNSDIQEQYKKVSKHYEPFYLITPISKPYFHLSSDSFYHIKWKDDSAPKGATAAPTSKYLREHVEYAYLDEELWELLQDEGARNEIKDAIVNFFIKPSTTL